jgi:hypothetical protein
MRKILFLAKIQNNGFFETILGVGSDGNPKTSHQERAYPKVGKLLSSPVKRNI